MRAPGATPFSLPTVLWRQRQLIGQLTRREITGRYRSSALGLLWSFVTPLFTLALYTFVFGVVFQARWPGASTGELPEFGLMLFAGMTAFSLFSETVVRLPALVTSSPNYVKRVVFPLEVLPVSVVGAALFHAGISVLILAIARFLILGGITWTVLLVPVVLLPMAMLSLGIAWLLASLGVFLRDIGHLVGLVSQALMLTSPIFYPIDAVPDPFRAIVVANPLTPIVESMRRVSVAGLLPDWSSLAWSAVIGAAALVIGYSWFTATKRAFADVI